MERRHFTRVPCSAAVSLQHDERTVIGQLENLCLKGFFVRTSFQIPPETPVAVILFQPPQASLDLEARVLRTDGPGLAIEIERMPVESFARLRDIVSGHLHDPDAVLREVYRVVGCLH
jgi:hypothetical protein